MKLRFGMAALVIALSTPVMADDDFYGMIESRPDGKAGTWVIGGRSFDVPANVKLDEDHGPLKVGVCAEVDIDDGVVEEIESKRDNSRCQR
ncbi:MAG: hypothetical protein Q8L72_06200 [Moraxellaceae bacterium]|nr:hypothetical protein [Moraxellaceae bacterium]